ncbi:DUF6479 family protein [Streptomyces sp. NPDC003635]
MNNTWLNLAAESGALGIGLIVAGVVVVALLLGAFVLGARVRRREPGPPRPEDQPHLPPEGATRETTEMREPDEMPRSDHRTLPHEMPAHGNIPSRPSPSKKRPRWGGSSSGSFGSGGPGQT